jgi:hypothetical protein
MKQLCTLLLSLILAYGIMFAQESKVTIDSDVYDSMLAGESTETITSGAYGSKLDQESTEALTGDEFGSHILVANPGPGNNGGSANWAIFFNLIAGPGGVTITGMTTASNATPDSSYSIEFFTRSGNALGGPVGSGPGSSSDGWTSLGTVPVTQGSVTNGISLLFATPIISINPGDTTGVAMQFFDAGPRYFGTGTPPYGTYADTNLTLITGDARSTPFTPTGTWFSSRELVGEIHYDEPVPVELVSFTASVHPDGNAVELSWLTATELNNQGFQVERKTESTSWDNIGFVNGYGTTTETQFYSFIDQNLNPGSYFYRLKQIDFDGSFKYYELAETVEIGALQTFYLSQNFPNPFNPATIISWQVPVDGYTTLKVYDDLGREVATLVNEEKPAGNYEVEFNASELASGVYYYRIISGDFVDTKKMILMK